MSRFACHRTLFAGCVIVTSLASAMAASPEESKISFVGDMRLLAAGLDRTNREGEETYIDEGIARIRAGASWTWNSEAMLVGRIATSVSTTDNKWRVGAFQRAQTTSGLETRAATFDLLYLQLASTDRLAVRIGRFQDSVALPAVPDKSLDRKDSDNVSISYTDGVSLDWKLAGGWNLLAIAQYQPPEGATNRPRAPLTFDDSESRLSGFVSLQNAQKDGPWAMRSLNVTVLPDTLASGGESKSYAAAVGNIALRWPAASVGMHAVVGGSLGYAPRVPERAQSYDDPNWAWQATANLMNFAPLGQSVGVVWMRSGAGWLLSPDIAANTQLWEIRHQIKPLKRLTLETRFRYRIDDGRAPGATAVQRDRDWYLRLTWRY